jgi:putative hydrolase of HD superfamily
MPKADDIIKFAKVIGKLKRTPRTGWKMAGVKNYESVAEHSLRVALLAMLLSDLKGKRADKLVRMALVHDLEEAVTGDIVTFHKTKEKQKALERSRKGIKKALSVLPKNLQEKYIRLWEETEQLKTADSKFLKQLDYIEQMFQASEYEHEQGINLQQFWEFMEKKFRFTDPIIMEIFKRLKKQRPKKFKKMGVWVR